MEQLPKIAANEVTQGMWSLTRGGQSVIFGCSFFVLKGNDHLKMQIALNEIHFCIQLQFTPWTFFFSVEGGGGMSSAE